MVIHGIWSLVPTILLLIQHSEPFFFWQPPHNETYDFIIVGAGAGGCVLANRLTENKKWNVLLLEAGGEETYIMTTPYLIGVYQELDPGWHYTSEPSPTAFKSLRDERCDYASGHVMGGSSSLNHMVYVRGNKRDYDNWEAMGNPGWGYDSLLPLFKKDENIQIPGLTNSSYHGTGGSVKVIYPPCLTKLSDLVVKAGIEMGEKEVDYNGESQTGFSHMQSMISEGRRVSAARAFVDPVKNRKNLHVKIRSLVYEILIHKDNKTAYGVRYMKGGQKYTALARKEVIISAGAFNSPQLLMLSGIGPKDHLQDLDIPLIMDLKVGYNLMDHFIVTSLLFVVNKSITLEPANVLSNPLNYIEYTLWKTGPLTSPLGIDSVSFLEVENTSDYSPGWPNIETLYVGGLLTNKKYSVGFRISDKVYNKVYRQLQSKHTIEVLPMQLRPKSRGRVTLKDKKISSPPIIDPMAFSHEDDIKTQIAGIRKMIELSKTDVFQSVGAKLHDTPLPACEQFEFSSDEYWTCTLHEQSFSIYHQCGTCKMGPETDEDAVVDPELKVYGIKNLRVVDASIMPQIPSGHLGSSTFVVAEKAAELIKNEYGEE